MHRFKILKICGEERKVKKLLNDMKSKKGGIFVYNRNLAVDYANNIFRDISDVGCFKTSRVSLFSSNVWLLFDRDHIIVTNITSEIKSSLSKVEYNIVLDTFLNDFIRTFLNNELSDLEIIMTSGVQSMNDLLSEESFAALNEWNLSYVDNYMEEDFVVYGLWIKAIVAIFKNEDNLYYDDFKDWLIDDCHWPAASQDKIHDFYIRYELGRDVLKEWFDESKE